MWPWPMEAADHTGRHVDRRHITDWPRWGSLRHRWTERRLSWCAILFVSRPSIHRARSAWADCGPPVNPISCAARRRIRAIENCVSRLLPSLGQRQVTMLVALAERLNPTSRRATLQPPLAYCVTEFGRLFVRPPRLEGSFHRRRDEDQNGSGCRERG
jgi:hypothetical protein